MKNICLNCKHILQINRPSDRREWFECEIAGEGNITEIDDPKRDSCKFFKEYTRNSCFDCWYYISEYKDSGELDYYYCHLTNEKLLEMKRNCEKYRKENM